MAGEIKTAIIGLGRAGWSLHAEPMSKINAYKIVAAADVREDRRKEAEQTYGCKTYESIEDLLKKEKNLDLVVIATQSYEHAKQSIMALKKGCNVLSEKPFAVNVKEGKKVIEAWKKSGKIFTIHQSARLGADVVYLKKFLKEDKRIGRVFHFRRSQIGFARRKDWQTLRKYGGGSLNNNGVHGLDGCRLLLDCEVKDVWGDLQRVNAAGDAEDHVKVMLRAKNGTTVDYELTSACACSSPDWVLYGTLGTLWIESQKVHIKWYNPSDLPPIEPEDTASAAERKYGFGETIPLKEETLDLPPYTGPNFHQLLADTIVKGKGLLVEPTMCMEVVEIMERARKGTEFPPM
jgi:scyllo-inositol 2-dehydrogenase (NADP+)